MQFRLRTGGGLLIAGLVSAALTRSLAQSTPPVSSAASADVAIGKAIFDARCIQCHGVDGKGNGPAAELLTPHPRDLSSGKFKIRTTSSGSLPTDEDIKAAISLGLHGSSMLAWKPFISAAQVDELVRYVKNLSPRFATERPQPIVETPPPALTPDLVSNGRAQYDRLKCGSCHTVESSAQGAIGSTLSDDWGRRVRAAALDQPWTFRGGGTARDIYLRLKTGMNGTPMPSYAEAATDEQLWQVATYVTTLARKPVWQMNAAEVTVFYEREARKAREQPIVQGEYLVRTLGCLECHSPITEDGSMMAGLRLAGGQRWTFGPFGSMTSTNLTSDKETGIGSISDDVIKRSISRGIRRDGSRMLPFPMPWTAYSNLNPDDLNALVTYLRALPPISNKIPPPQKADPITFFWGKFQMLILGRDIPLLTYPGNAGTMEQPRS